MYLLAFLHAHLLFAERAEEVFHQSPVEERPVLVHPRHFKVCEVAHLRPRNLRGSHEPLLVIEIDEHFHRVAWTGTLRHIAARQEYLPLVASVEVQTEVNLLHDGKYVVVAELYHMSQSFCFLCM